MRRLVVLLTVAVLALVVVDRGALVLTERALSRGLVDSGGLAGAPEVSVRGFPFLTQAVRGRYERVDVRSVGVPAGQVRLDELEVVLTGVRVPLSEVVAGDVEVVPVDLVQARGLIAYADLARRAGAGAGEVTLAPVGDRLRVTGEIEVRGRVLSISATSSLVVQGDELVVTAETFESGSGFADELLERALGDGLDLRVPLTGLPYGLRVRAVEVAPRGVVVRADAADVVLRPLPAAGEGP